MAVVIIVKNILLFIVFLIYSVFVKIIPLIVAFGIPLFLVGILVGLLGVSGHILFLLLIGYAIYKYYDVVLRSVFKINKKSSKKTVKFTGFMKKLNPFKKKI